MLRQEREKHPDLLLFDSGDFFQGSAYFTMFKGEVEVGLMNRMGYDAVMIGNHEFDAGLEEMARIFRLANFPIVCANYDFTGTPVEGLVKPYIIIKRNGVKIGVFGIGKKIEGLVAAKNCVGVKYLDPAKVALETAMMLKDEKKCDVVICLSHLGWKIGGDDDQYMVSHSRNIDLVLGGHSHTYLVEDRYEKNLDGKDVLVDHEGKHSIFVGKMILNLYSK
jgi:5'-nucleotidase